MPWTHSKHIALRTKLASAYLTYPEQVEFVRSVTLDPSKIAFHAVSMLSWQAILLYAEQQQRTRAVLDRALQDFPTDQDLLDLANDVEPPPKVDSTTAPARWANPQRTPHQLISSESTLVDVKFLADGARVARAVCRILINGRAMGTGFLTPGNLVFTNHHVLTNAGSAKRAEAEFDYELGAASSKRFRLDPQRFFQTGGDTLQGDWSAVAVHGDPEALYGSIALRDLVPAANQWVNIIQHPDGLPKRVSYSGNLIRWVGDDQNGTPVASQHPTLVQYLTDTMPGSSGAPVFDKDWNLVAIHHGEFKAGDRLEVETPGGSVRTYVRNEGVLLSHVLRSFKPPS